VPNGGRGYTYDVSENLKMYEQTYTIQYSECEIEIFIYYTVNKIILLHTQKRLIT